MKTHARVRRATSKTPRSVVKARVFLPSLRSAQFVIYIVHKGIWQQPSVHFAKQMRSTLFSFLQHNVTLHSSLSLVPKPHCNPLYRG